MEDMFYKCSSLTSLNFSNFNTNNVKDMSYMFYNCSNLISLKLTNLDNNIIDMRCIFIDCTKLTSLNLSNFNTNNVKDMDNMFFCLKKNCKVTTKDNKILWMIQSI